RWAPHRPSPETLGRRATNHFAYERALERDASAVERRDGIIAKLELLTGTEGELEVLDEVLDVLAKSDRCVDGLRALVDGLIVAEANGLAFSRRANVVEDENQILADAVARVVKNVRKKNQKLADKLSKNSGLIKQRLLAALPGRARKGKSKPNADEAKLTLFKALGLGAGNAKTLRVSIARGRRARKGIAKKG
ncbi:MAG: hypothetical protein M3O46_21450, partial [Myxococcota bacterium]|nr:hypothetical protein [Myxococcota bacterium]